jgi:pSer/pThr/pTyr-binding forkhead associated (FHA) protein
MAGLAGDGCCRASSQHRSAEDNDLRLDHATVHRHHAVLQRTSDARFIICDLSGASGNGIKVNGSRVAQAALADGDRIEVGSVVLDFETQPA